MVTSTGTGRPWLRVQQPAEGVAKLVLFPHAGGSASFFRPWTRRTGSEIEVAAVQYPGRADRLNEPCVTTIGQMSAAVSRELCESDGRPLVLFGHSMGAAVAYETAKLLTARGKPPAILAVSGRGAPHRAPDEGYHTLDDDALWARVRELGGTDSEVLDNPDLRELLTPAVRADFEASENYRDVPDGPALDCPVVAYGGSADPVAPPTAVAEWATVTSGSFDQVVYPGDHFYLDRYREGLLSDLLPRIPASSHHLIR